MRGMRIVTLLTPFGLLALSGCCAAARQSSYCSDHYLRPLNAVPIATVPAPQPPPCGVPLQPPQPALGTPVPGVGPPVGFAPLPSEPIQQVWGQPANPQASLGLPEPAGQAPRQSATLETPETPEPPAAAAKPEPKEEPAASPVMPLGIAGFAPVKEGISTGRRPILDGLDWLKKHEYRTVLHLRRPGVNDETDRKEFETRRGMKYLSLEVQHLTQEFVDRFNEIVNDPERRPLFVYDEKGQLNGALWYLYLRTSEKLSDEDARKKASALGFKEDDPANRDLWLAIQQYLNDRAPKP